MIVILDNLKSWKDHERQCNLKQGKKLLHHTKQVLIEAFFKLSTFFYIHSYLSYPDIGWASTKTNTKTNKIHVLAKQSVQIVCSTKTLDQLKTLLEVARKHNYKNSML